MNRSRARAHGEQQSRVTEEYGRPYADVLVDLLEQGYSPTDVATELGVSYATIRHWIAINGIGWVNHDDESTPALVVKRGDKITIQRSGGGKTEITW